MSIAGLQGGRRLRLPLIAVIALFAALLFAPAGASALQYTVDNTADTAGGACTAAPADCTFRSAIELSNASVGTIDQIFFDGGVFNGELADTINLGSGLPTISDPVGILGGSCAVGGAPAGPCAGVNGPAGGFGLRVETDNSTIGGLAITGALVGISVTGESINFNAVRNWLGIKLDGSPGANNTGIFIDPGSDEAKIGGGGDPLERNVFGYNNNIGLDLEGASGATIRGNFFGVAPDGVTQATNPTNIDISASTAGSGSDATGNVIGEQLSNDAASSPSCDGGCNVISGATFLGIDLKGDGPNEAPAGETSIRGNHIGLTPSGEGLLANGNLATLGSGAIRVGGAEDVTIGGPSAGFINHINGATPAIKAGPSADGLLVEGNMIGLNHSGVAALGPPTTEGIGVDGDSTSAGGEATIASNRISMGAGIAISHTGSGSGSTGPTIADNVIGRGVSGGDVLAPGFGIYLADSVGAGATVEGNVVANTLFTGIAIESSDNLVIGNEIEDPGDTGISIQGAGGDGNTIGGDVATEENTISGAAGNAIETGPASTDNRFLRNVGSGNGGLFIDLGGDGPGNAGPNGGIQVPVITAATPAGVNGTAEPNATVRVFEKATSAPGEIEAFIAEVEADGSGSWALAFAPALAEGTNIGVTQTGPDGTSELALATATSPIVPPPPGGGGAGGPAPLPAADRTPPQTKITKGPKGKSSRKKAKFNFASNEAGSKFECKLDRKPFKKCRSPKKYSGLKPGKHVFKVRAIDAAGNRDPSPAVKRFKVLGSA